MLSLVVDALVNCWSGEWPSYNCYRNCNWNLTFDTFTCSTITLYQQAFAFPCVCKWLCFRLSRKLTRKKLFRRKTAESLIFFFFPRILSTASLRVSFCRISLQQCCLRIGNEFPYRDYSFKVNSGLFINQKGSCLVVCVGWLEHCLWPVNV